MKISIITPDYNEESTAAELPESVNLVGTKRELPMKPFTKRAFTLIEIMVAIAILAILAAIVIPNFMSYRTEAHNKACRENKEIILHACTLCEIQKNEVITEMTKLCDSSTEGGLRREPHCPIGGEYTISYDAASGFSVTCSKDSEHEKD